MIVGSESGRISGIRPQSISDTGILDIRPNLYGYGIRNAYRYLVRKWRFF
jgi:hypothetical protein